jgi:hypothetical protein
MNIPKFVAKWKSSTLTERAAAQSWFSDLCRVLTVPTPTVTFPFPWHAGTELVDDQRVIAIAAAAKELDEKSRAWLDPPGASDADLKKRTLTNLYNERPTWPRNLHARLDRAVWDSYGWPPDEIPGEVGEEVILERLLTLNIERSPFVKH